MPKGRTIAIGDVHGCDIALERLLGVLAPNAGDLVIHLGDVCDRGPDTRRTIDLLIDLSRRCDLRLILGNHDEMMLGVFGRHFKCDLSFWWGVGGAETIESYGGDPEQVPAAHLDFLESGLPYFETETEIFVHADLEPDVPLAEQDGDWLRWRKIRGDEPPHRSGKRVICGHTSQKSGDPLAWDGWACLDTRVFDEGGWLTGLVVGPDEVYQANQRGDVRGPFPLSDSFVGPNRPKAMPVRRATPPRLITGPKIIEAAGNKPKMIREYVGRVNTGTADVSIAHMTSPAGWVEPGQRPDFDEYTVVLRGTLRVEHEAGYLDVQGGQAVLTRAGEWVRYSTPTADGADYVAVCLPAFSPDTVHRDSD